MTEDDLKFECDSQLQRQSETQTEDSESRKRYRSIGDDDYIDDEYIDDDENVEDDDNCDNNNDTDDHVKNKEKRKMSCDSRKSSSSSSPMSQPLNLQVIKSLEQSFSYQHKESHTQPLKSQIMNVKQQQLHQQTHALSSLEHAAARLGNIESDRRIVDILDPNGGNINTPGSELLIRAALSPSTGTSIFNPSLRTHQTSSQQSQQPSQQQQEQLFKTFSALPFAFDFSTIIKKEDSQRTHSFGVSPSASGPSGFITTPGVSSANIPMHGSSGSCTSEISIVSAPGHSPILSAAGISNIDPSCSGSGTGIPQPGTSMGGGNQWGAFTCKKCGNTYARPHSLNRHLRFECGVEPKFECPICHKKSKHKHNLVLHMRTHNHR